MTRRARMATVCVTCVAAALTAVYWLVPSVSRLDADAQQRYGAASDLWRVWGSLEIAAANRPAGGGCTSMAEAIRYVNALQSNHPAFWRCRSATNGFIHPNPDWAKWRAPGTNEVLNELAAFCDVPLMNSNRSTRVYIGLTFDNQIVELAVPPAWPKATDWLADKGQ